MTDKDMREGVRVVDVDMPFGSMVKFMVKWAIASIPALIILMVIGAIVGGVIAGFSTGLISSLASRAATSPPSSITGLPATPKLTVPSTPEWELTQSSNPLDDSPIVVLSLEASSPSKTMLGGAPTLILRCKSKKAETYINWNAFLGTEEVRVTTRVGHEAASTRLWSLSSDNRASFYLGNTGQLIGQLMAVDTLVVMTTPYSQSPVTAVFEVAGLGAKVQPLRQACALQ